MQNVRHGPAIAALARRAGAAIDAAPCTTTLREERPDRNQYDVHHSMHPPPRPSACALHPSEMHFRDTSPTPFSRTPTRVIVAENASCQLFSDVRRRMHRSVRPRELPDARVRSVARHAGDCRCRPASTVENKQRGARGGRGGAALACTPTAAAHGAAAAGRRPPLPKA